MSAFYDQGKLEISHIKCTKKDIVKMKIFFLYAMAFLFNYLF